MRLWTYQHPAVLNTLQQGKRHLCSWDCESNQRWQNAYRWMAGQMNQHGIETGLHPPVWAWHSVNCLGGKPDTDCANALLTGFQLKQGIDLIELEAPDHLVLVSGYGPWNQILDRFMDGEIPDAQEAYDCFAVKIKPHRGRPRRYFRDIQACLPFIEPSWVISWETLDTVSIQEERRIGMEKVLAFYKPLPR